MPIPQKRRDFAKEVQKGLLCEVLGFNGIMGHPQAQRIDAALVGVEEGFESPLIALLSARDRQLLANEKTRGTRAIVPISPPAKPRLRP